jgi:hypothetical protein
MFMPPIVHDRSAVVIRPGTHLRRTAGVSQAG